MVQWSVFGRFRLEDVFFFRWEDRSWLSVGVHRRLIIMLPHIDSRSLSGWNQHSEVAVHAGARVYPQRECFPTCMISYLV